MNEKTTKETFESLWEYCISNNHVCPIPLKWNSLFNMLKNNDQLNLPLILNGWEMSSSLEKNLRFKEHVQSASHTKQLDEVKNYLSSLSEEDWVNYLSLIHI